MVVDPRGRKMYLETGWDLAVPWMALQEDLMVQRQLPFSKYVFVLFLFFL